MFEKFLKELNNELDKAGITDKESVIGEYKKRYDELLSQNLSAFEIIVLFGDPADIARRLVSPDYNRSARQSLKNNSMLKKGDKKKNEKESQDSSSSISLGNVEVDDEQDDFTAYRDDREIVNKNIENYKAFIYQLEKEIEEIEDKIKILLDEIARRRKEKQDGIAAKQNPITENDINLAMELEKQLQSKQEELMNFYQKQKEQKKPFSEPKRAGLRNTDEFRKIAEENKKKILQSSAKEDKKEPAKKQSKGEEKEVNARQNKKESEIGIDIPEKEPKFPNSREFSEKENIDISSAADNDLRDALSNENGEPFGAISRKENADISSESEEKKDTASQPKEDFENEFTEKSLSSKEEERDGKKEDGKADLQQDSDGDKNSEDGDIEKKFTTVEYYDSETGENISNFLNIHFYRDPDSGKTQPPPEKGEIKQNIKRIKVVEEIETPAHKPEDISTDGIEKTVHDLSAKGKKGKSEEDSFSQNSENEESEKKTEKFEESEKDAKEPKEESLLQKDKFDNLKGSKDSGIAKNSFSDKKSDGVFSEPYDEETLNDETEILKKIEKNESEDSLKERNPFLEKDYTFVGGKKINTESDTEKKPIEQKETKTSSDTVKSDGTPEEKSSDKIVAEEKATEKEDAARKDTEKKEDATTSAQEDTVKVSDKEDTEILKKIVKDESEDSLKERNPFLEKDYTFVGGKKINTEFDTERKPTEQKETKTSFDTVKSDGTPEEKPSDKIVAEEKTTEKEDTARKDTEKKEDATTSAQEDTVKVSDKEDTEISKKDIEKNDEKNEPDKKEDVRNEKTFKKGIDVIVKKADPKEDKSYLKDKARAIEKSIIEEHIDELVFEDSKMRGWRSVKTKIKKPKVLKKSDILPDKINFNSIKMDVIEAEDTVKTVLCGNNAPEKQAEAPLPSLKTGFIASQVKQSAEQKDTVVVAQEEKNDTDTEHILLSKVLYRKPEQGKILRKENLPIMVTTIVLSVFIGAFINLVALFGGFFIIINSLEFLISNFSNTVVVANQLNISVALIFVGLLMIAGTGISDAYYIKWLIESVRDCYEIVRLLGKTDSKEESLYEVIKIPVSTHEPRLFNIGSKKPIDILKKPGGLSDDMIYNKDFKKVKNSKFDDEKSVEQEITDENIKKDNKNYTEEKGRAEQTVASTQSAVAEQREEKSLPSKDDYAAPEKITEKKGIETIVPKAETIAKAEDKELQKTENPPKKTEQPIYQTEKTEFDRTDSQNAALKSDGSEKNKEREAMKISSERESNKVETLSEVYGGEKMLHGDAKERSDIIPTDDEKTRIREEARQDLKQDVLEKEIRSEKALRKEKKEEKKKAKLFKKLTGKAEIPEKKKQGNKDGIKMEDTVFEGINLNKPIDDKKIKNDNDEKSSNSKITKTDTEEGNGQSFKEEDNSTKEEQMKDLLFTDPDKKAISSDDIPKSSYKEINKESENNRSQQLQKGKSVSDVVLKTPDKTSVEENSEQHDDKKDGNGGDININEWFY